MDNQLQLIRGARIFTQLLEVSTVPKLETDIERGFPTTRKRQHIAHTVRVKTVEFIPFKGTKLLHVRATTTGDHKTEYKQSLQLTNVEFVDPSTPQAVTFQAADTGEYSVLPLKLQLHNVKVRCSCLDFYWRFTNYNSQDKSLVGRPNPPYQKKTDRPPVNPMQVPGVCKHLLALVTHLQRIGLITT